MGPRPQPPWWEWELELSPHVEQRMADRGFSEVDLRSMFDNARTVEPDHVEGRSRIRTAHRGRPWTVIVEPDEEVPCIVVVTAYPKD